MAYSRREIYDFKTVITAALYNNLQDGIEELFKQISLVTETGIPKLMVFPLFEVATEESQTVFPINLSTFDEDTDTVFVHSGRTTLAPEQDYIIENNTIVLNEGVPKGRTILIYIFKNVPIGKEGSVSGSVITDKTLPLKKLAEMPSAEDVGARPDDWMPTASDVGAIPRGGTRIGEIGFDVNNELYILIDGTLFKLPFGYGRYDAPFLPLTGGTMSGELLLNGGYGRLHALGEFAYLYAHGTGNTSGDGRALMVLNEKTTLNDSIRLRNKSGSTSTDYRLFGEHNKPIGSYTGNGSATQRIVNVGGISDVCFIIGSGWASFVTPLGALCFNQTNENSVVSRPYTEIKFTQGVLTIATDTNIFNVSGKTYWYQVL